MRKGRDVAVFVNSFFEKRVDRIFDLAERVEAAPGSPGGPDSDEADEFPG
jgi:hypothetical protein